MVMAKSDQRIYRVTNPMFLENKRGFISKEPGIRDLREEPVLQRAFEVPATSSGTGGGITTALGANNASNKNGSTSTASAEGTPGENGVDEAEVESGSIGDEGGQSTDLTNQRPEISTLIYASA